MLRAAYLFVGTIAFLWTVLTVLAAVYMDTRDGTGDMLAMVGGIVGFVLWGVWTFGSFNIEVVDGGVAYSFTHPELAFVGVTMALVPGYIAFTGPFELVKRARDPRQEDL